MGTKWSYGELMCIVSVQYLQYSTCRVVHKCSNFVIGSYILSSWLVPSYRIYGFRNVSLVKSLLVKSHIFFEIPSIKVKIFCEKMITKSFSKSAKLRYRKVS